MAAFKPLQMKLGRGEGTEARTTQIEFAAPQKSKGKTLLTKKEQRDIEKRKASKGKREYGLEAYGVEKAGQPGLMKFFERGRGMKITKRSQYSFEGQKEYDKIESMYNRGLITTADRTMLHKDLRKLENEEAKAAGSMIREKIKAPAGVVAKATHYYSDLTPAEREDLARCAGIKTTSSRVKLNSGIKYIIKKKLYTKKGKFVCHM